MSVVNFFGIHPLKVPVHKIQFRSTIYQPQLSYMVANAALLLLHFVMMMQTLAFAVQVALIF
jgi:hypothetical protein